MLLKKIDQGRAYLEKHGELFACPKCSSKMSIKENTMSFVCQNHHQYDLSKKGTLHFLSHHIKTDYDKEMLVHRQEMIKSGLYQPLVKKIADLMRQIPITSMVDMGCGEGSFLQALADEKVPGTKIGFDISKDGVFLATNQPVEAFWCIADMTNLPFASQSMSHLLNIFSPSHYSEFTRVLQKEGLLIKVVPEENYLKELREVFYVDNESKQVYSNEKVVNKFSQEMTLLSQERLTYQVPVSEENQEHLLRMSPLHWGASKQAFAQAKAQGITEITIDVLVLVGKSKM